MDNEKFTDITITCYCGKDFTWDAKSQKFFHQRQFHEPKTCPSCLQKRRVAKAERLNQSNEAN